MDSRFSLSILFRFSRNASNSASNLSISSVLIPSKISGGVRVIHDTSVPPLVVKGCLYDVFKSFWAIFPLVLFEQTVRSPHFPSLLLPFVSPFLESLSLFEKRSLEEIVIVIRSCRSSRGCSPGICVADIGAVVEICLTVKCYGELIFVMLLSQG